DSLIVGNSAGDFGGGIDNQGALDVRTSTIANNNSITSGGGIDNGSTANQLVVNRSAVINNLAVQAGGGIRNVSTVATAVVTDTTLVGNISEGGTGGGAISTANAGASTAVLFATITNNSDTSDNAAGAGGISATAG